MHTQRQRNFGTTDSRGHSISKLKYGFVRAKHRSFHSFCKDVRVLKRESVKTSWNEREVLVNSHRAQYFVVFGTQKKDAFQNLSSPTWSWKKGISYFSSRKRQPQESFQNSRLLSRRRSEPRGSGLSRKYIKCTFPHLCVITRNIRDIKKNLYQT